MAVSTKGKRQVEVDGERYVWQVVNRWGQSHFDGLQVSIAAETGSLLILYGLQQDPTTRHLWVEHRRIACPRFEGDDGVVSTSGVRRLIEWYLRHR